MRTHWSNETIRAGLSAVATDRMPTANELRSIGRNDLACAISRAGGFRLWATRLGLPQKGTETHFAQQWERYEATRLRDLGHVVVEQTTRAPFDLLVDGARWDVKAAHFSVYENGSGLVRGYVFSGLKRGESCDVFDLLCIEAGEVKHRFLVPSGHARVVTITITPKTLAGHGKYSAYLGSMAARPF